MTAHRQTTATPVAGNMRIVVEPQKVNFTQIYNSVLQDHRLSHMARGIHHEILSHHHDPEPWSTTADDMWRAARKVRPGKRRGEGQEAYRTAFGELAAAGYLERRKIRQPDGRFTTELVVLELPQNTLVKAA